ncbi:MAG: hypothetical protein L6W00_16820 [Lentisphaeria bacterium]|nr:MAG: hypothetical protein L6W00_16820 [Lentisphaeria bacterium]
MVNLVNEDVLHTNWAMSQTTTELYLKRFEIWKQKSGCPDARAGNDSREFLYFLQTQQDACLEELLRFAKQELKLRCPVTSLNYLNDVTLALSRKKNLTWSTTMVISIILYRWAVDPAAGSSDRETPSNAGLSSRGQ